MDDESIDVQLDRDGTLVIHPRGVLDAAHTVELRRTIVRVLRRTRPLRLVVDMSDLHELDAINLGTLAAACYLGDDHRVAVFLDHSSQPIADRLAAAGVPRHRLRHVAPCV